MALRPQCDPAGGHPGGSVTAEVTQGVVVAGRRRPAPGMAWIPGGTFLMGSDHHYPEEAPAHRVSVEGFWVDQNTVTNRQFARFVAKTGYVTVAEQTPNAADYPGADPELLGPASTVFRSPAQRVDLRDHYQWWIYVPGADWRHPQGPGSSIKERPDHPVVHVAWDDVEGRPADHRPPERDRPGWPTPGRVNFRSGTSSRTGTRGPH